MDARVRVFCLVDWGTFLVSLGLVLMALCFVGTLETKFHGLCLLPDYIQLIVLSIVRLLGVAETWNHWADKNWVSSMVLALVSVQCQMKQMRTDRTQSSNVFVESYHIQRVNLAIDIWASTLEANLLRFLNTDAFLVAVAFRAKIRKLVRRKIHSWWVVSKECWSSPYLGRAIQHCDAVCHHSGDESDGSIPLDFVEDLKNAIVVYFVRQTIQTWVVGTKFFRDWEVPSLGRPMVATFDWALLLAVMKCLIACQLSPCHRDYRLHL